MPSSKSPSSSGKKKRKSIKKGKRSSLEKESRSRRQIEPVIKHLGPQLDEDGDPLVSDEEEAEREERVRLSHGVDGKGSTKKSKKRKPESSSSSSSSAAADWDSLKGAEFDMSDDEGEGTRGSEKPTKAELFVAAAIGDGEDGEADSDSEGNSGSAAAAAAGDSSDDEELDEDREEDIRRAVELRAQSKKVDLFGGNDEDSDSDDSKNDDSDDDSDSGAARGGGVRASGPRPGDAASDSDEAGDSGEDSEDEDGGAGAEDLIRRQGESFEDFAERVEIARRKETEAAKAEMQIHTLGRDSDRYHLPTEAEIDEERRLPPDLEAIRERMRAVVLVLSDFKARRQEHRSRGDYLERLTEDAVGYYGYSRELVELFLKIFRPVEALEFFEANEQPRPLTLRVNTLKARRKQVAQALINRGVNLDPLAQWSRDGLVVHESNIPIGATPEYLTGHYFIQSASSMMSVLALDPRPGERVIDVAAAPGGKTTHIAQLMRNRGALVANDPSPLRSRSLVANLARLGVTCAVTSCLDGREIHKVFGLGSFDRVLLDAPCTGLGVIAKDPSVKTQKTYDDVKKMAYLQKQLCLAAVDAVDHASPTGGIFVYSTCSVSVEENEAVVDYVLRKRHVKLVPVQDKIDVGRPAMPAYYHHRFHPSVKLARRFLPHVHNMDGFFVAKFRKISPGAKDASAEDEDEEASGGGAAMEGDSSDDDSTSDRDEEDSDDEEDEEEEVYVKPRRRKDGKLIREPVRKAKSRVSPSAADLRRMEEEAKVQRKKDKAKKRGERKAAKRAAKLKAADGPAAMEGEADGSSSAGRKRGRSDMEAAGEEAGEGAEAASGAGSDGRKREKGKGRKRERRNRKKKRRTEAGEDGGSQEVAKAEVEEAAESAPDGSNAAAGTASAQGVLGKRVKGKKKRLATIGSGDAERAMGRKAAESAAMAVYQESELQRLQDERKRTGADKLESMGMRKSMSSEQLQQEAKERADAILGEAEAVGSARAFKLKGKRKRMVKPAEGKAGESAPKKPGKKGKGKKEKAAAASGAGAGAVSSEKASSSSSSASAAAESPAASASTEKAKEVASSSGKKKKKSKGKKAGKASDGAEDEAGARKRVSFGGQDVREFDKFMKPRAAGMDIDEARKVEGRGGGKKKGKKGGKKSGRGR